MSLHPLLLQPVLRGQDLPIEIGHRHGYRIDGDHVLIHAEVLVPPGRSDGAWSLELWAADRAYTDRARMEEPLTGARVAQVALELPDPIAPHVHQVDTRTVARLPMHGRACGMVLALIEHRPDGGSSLRGFANYPELQLFSAPHFVGRVGYAVQGAEVVLEAEGISNPRASTNLSGTLALELWAFPEAGLPTAREGVRLAWSELAPIAGQSQSTAIERRVAFTEPPEGRFGLSLILGEWTVAHGYVARDRRDFACIYEAGTKELPASSAAGSPVPAAVEQPTPARPIDRLRLVPGAALPGASAAAAAAVTGKPKPGLAPPAGPRLISIQTGSLEELAGVKGLSLKIAKEIVKARPFSSLPDLIRVRGLGDKTIARVKHLLTL